jgi:type IV secretory pathway VirB4 component
VLSVKRILRDYQDAGSLNSLLSLWGFIDDTTFLTKAGHVGVAFRLKGIDYEGLTQAQRAAFVHRFEAALRLLDEHCRVYQYLIKRTIRPLVSAACAQPIAREALQERTAYLNSRRHDLFELELYVALLYEAATTPRTSTRLHDLWRSPVTALRAWLSPMQTLHLVDGELDRAIAALHHKAEGLEVQLGEFGIERLPKSATFRFFRQLVNYDATLAESASLTYDTHLDYFVADSPIECHRDHLRIGRQHAKVLSMKEPPSQTFAHLLGDLHAIPGEFIACLEWQRIPSDRMRRDLQMRRRHFFNKRVSIVNYVAPRGDARGRLGERHGAAIR